MKKLQDFFAVFKRILECILLSTYRVLSEKNWINFFLCGYIMDLL